MFPLAFSFTFKVASCLGSRYLLFFGESFRTGLSNSKTWDIITTDKTDVKTYVKAYVRTDARTIRGEIIHSQYQ